MVICHQPLCLWYNNPWGVIWYRDSCLSVTCFGSFVVLDLLFAFYSIYWFQLIELGNHTKCALIIVVSICASIYCSSILILGSGFEFDRTPATTLDLPSWYLIWELMDWWSPSLIHYILALSTIVDPLCSSMAYDLLLLFITLQQPSM